MAGLKNVEKYRKNGDFLYLPAKKERAGICRETGSVKSKLVISRFLLFVRSGKHISEDGCGAGFRENGKIAKNPGGDLGLHP